MANATELFRQGKTREIWQKYCGFIDLSIDEFMKIQERLLMEQIDLLSKCELGKKIIGDKIPKNVEEFRKNVPLTTYEDYAPYLLKKREDILPEKPYIWAHTTGKTGMHKWIPYTKKMYEVLGEAIFAALIFATSKKKGDFVLNEGDSIFYCVAPPPYLSGIMYRALGEEFNVTFIPPLEQAEKMDFMERIEEGFRMSLRKGMDIFAGGSSILANIGQRFSGEGQNKISTSFLLHPLAAMRIIKALIKSKIARRNILPRDIWRLKGIVSGGVDTAIYGQLIEHYWGVRPLEGYGGTEPIVVATQLWDFGSLTFVPHSSFMEFIPEEDSIKSRKDPKYKPHTLLLNEVEPHQIYELVITNFHGGAFVRYRPDDLIRIVSLKNEKLGVDIPQMVFYSRASEVIDLASFARLTEGAIWQALENSKVEYNDWIVRKEIEDKQPVLRLYLELKKHRERGEEEIVNAIHQSLKKVDSDYNDIEKMLQLKPLRLTILSPDTFRRYVLKQQKEGADLGQFKPPRMKPSDKAIHDLLELSGQK